MFKLPWFKKRDDRIAKIEQLEKDLVDLGMAIVPKYENKLRDDRIWEKQWIIMPNGTLGVIDHKKPNSPDIAVRPVNPVTLEYYPNQSKHWSEEQRASVPHEVVIHKDLVRAAPPAAIPKRTS